MTTPLKKQILDVATGDSTLLALLHSGADSVYPRAAEDPSGETDGPFIVLTMGAETATSGITGTQFFTWYAYDDPISGFGYWRLDRIINRLVRLYDGYESFTFDGRAWGCCQYNDRSAEQTDQDWSKLMKYTRFMVPRV